MNKGREEFLTLQKQLKDLKEKGLYRGDLNIKKSEMKKALNRINTHLHTLDKDQIKLFKNQSDVFQNKKKIERPDKLKAQKKLIKDLKEQYQEIVKKTGLTGTSDSIFPSLSGDQSRFFKQTKPTNSVKENNQIIKDLRLALLPLLGRFNYVDDFTDFDTGNIKEVKDRLRELKKEGIIDVNLRQSNQKLKRILSNHVLKQVPTEIQEPEPEPNFEDIAVNVDTTNPRFKGMLKNLIISTEPNMKSLKSFFAKIHDTLLDELKQLTNNMSFKMYFILHALIYRKTDPFNTLKKKPLQSTKEKNAVPIPHRSSEDHLEEVITELQDIIEFLLENLNEQGSDWVLSQVLNLKVMTSTWNPLKGGSYIKLPECLNHAKSGLINIRNDDHRCFLYNNICHFHKPSHHRERVSHYKKYIDEFHTDGIQFPMSLSQIEKWDKMNNTRTFIYAPDIDKNGKFKGLEPIYRNTKNVDCPNEVAHLLLEDDTTGNYHFVYINNMSALSTTTKASHAKQYICYNCMIHFRSQEKLKDHKENSSCYNNNCCKVKMPNEGTVLKFTEYQRMNRLPFQVTFDIESDLDACENTKERFLNEHVPNSLSAHFYSDFGDNETVEFYGNRSECITEFMQWLISKEQYIKNKMIANEDMILSEADERSFQKAKNCCLCNQPFPKKYNTDKALYKVRDHNHFTGEYRGACHASCNLNYNNKNFVVPVIAHNLKGYDAQLIIREVCQFSTDYRKFECIPMNGEKFISFSLGRFRFVDSYGFLAGSLETHVNNLKKTEQKLNKKQFHHLENYYGHFGQDKLELLKQKGVYPYSYANGKNSFDIDYLPGKEWFHDDLKNEDISDDDYQHAQKVWEAFNCKTFWDYHLLYLKTDVLLLTDIWEAFRKTAMKKDGIDPAHFYGLPGYAFCVLKKGMMQEGQEPPELLSDYDHYTFCEREKRGGLAQISKRYAKANNRYCPWYDPSKPVSYIVYFDMNSLYPSVMSIYPLPHSNFQWKYNYTLEDILALDPFGEVGCAVECDLEYPEELHDEHNDYPCALESKEGDFSPLMQSLANSLGYKLPKNKKLIANLQDKKNYVCDYRCLQLYHSLGLRVTKIHKVLEFKQKYSMKSYVDKMRERRCKASLEKNKFLEQYYKDMMNIVYGKTVENERAYSSLEVCTSKERAEKKINSFRCKSWQEYGENMLTVDMDKKQQTFKKPIYLGCTILELSKLLMLEFHYNVIKKKYGDKAQLLFTDTDSLMYHIETKDVYDDMLDNYERFDFSAYDDNSNIIKKLEAKGLSEFVNKNRKAFGLMKDEQANDPIIEFCGRCPKEYSYRTASEHTEIKGKGIKSHVLNSKCSHEDAVNLILSSKDETQHSKENFERKVKFKNLRSVDHTVYTEETEKTAMSILDSKRYVCSDGVSTLAWGNHRIPSI